ncbi:ParA family protein [Allosaccharopolyspora coralli]|uniref:ParA family protein n=1 Tax=Allosaccharopolyspora coralli TaxID=2665642 RepID=UPI001651C363|nr:ParA family protein [Allosaccharopolyspora coralli]
MRITSVLNQKGGVGKTGLAAGIGGALADRGRRVLLVDLDPQGHLTTEALGLSEASPDGPTLPDALTGVYRGPAKELIARHSSSQAGGVLDVLPHALAMFVAGRELDKLPAREWRLARLLEELADDYDACVLDCPPALDILTDNALAAAHGVVIPVQPERTSMRALGLLLDQIEALEAALRRPRLHLHGLVPSVYRRPLGKLASSVMGEFGQLDHLPLLAHLPLSVTVTEAWDAGRTVTDYAPDSEHAQAYRTVADAIEGTPA